MYVLSLACAFGSCPCPRSSEYPRHLHFLYACLDYFTMLVAFLQQLFPTNPVQQQRLPSREVENTAAVCCCCCDFIVRRSYVRTARGAGGRRALLLVVAVVFVDCYFGKQ